MKRVFLFSGIACSALSNSSLMANALPADTIRNYDLNEVVVNATRATRETPMAFTDIEKEELSKKNYGQDIPYLISQTPSVVVTSDAGTGIGYTSFRVRGTDANRINITVNGVPVNDSESHTVFWVNMPDFASSVENVQIQRGAGTSTNGAAAFGASIAMQTQKPEMKPYAEYSGAGGSFATFKNTFKGGTGLLYDHFVFDARYSKIKSDGFIDRAKANLSSYYGSAAYYNGATMIKYQLFGSSERTNQAWNGVSSEKLAEGNRTYNSCGEYTENGVTKYYDQTDNYWQNHHHLNAAHKFNNAWSMNLTAHYTRGKGYYEDYKQKAKLKSYGLIPFLNEKGELIEKTDLVRRKWLRNHFYGGIYNASYTSESLDMTFGASMNNYDGVHFGRVIWARNYNNLSPDHEYYQSDASKLDYNAFVKATYRFTDHWNAFADLQYRGIDYRIDGTDDKAGKINVDKQFHFFNPKAGISFVKNAHSAFASFAVANREPNRNNFTEAALHERPTHETLFDYEAGYAYQGNGWFASMNAYYMDYKNQLILTGKISEIGEALTSNIKDSYRMGIELSGGVRICSWMDWKGNVAFSANKIENFIETVSNWDGADVEIDHGTTDIAFSPNVVANSIFGFNYRNFSANLSTVAVGRQYLDNTATADRSIDPYWVNNLQLGYTFYPRFMREICLGLQINNLLNEEYETNGWVYTAISEASGYTPENRYKEDGYFTQAGTNVMASVTFKF